MTSDGGLLLVRELDERLDLTGLIQNHLVDSPTEAQRFRRNPTAFSHKEKWRTLGIRHQCSEVLDD